LYNSFLPTHRSIAATQQAGFVSAQHASSVSQHQVFFSVQRNIAAQAGFIAQHSIAAATGSVQRIAAPQRQAGFTVQHSIATSRQFSTASQQAGFTVSTASQKVTVQHSIAHPQQREEWQGSVMQ
jgi:hypothetical protein